MDVKRRDLHPTNFREGRPREVLLRRSSGNRQLPAPCCFCCKPAGSIECRCASNSEKGSFAFFPVQPSQGRIIVTFIQFFFKVNIFNYDILLYSRTWMVYFSKVHGPKTNNVSSKGRLHSLKRKNFRKN